MVIKANSRLRIAVRAKHDKETNEVTTLSLVFPLTFRDTIDIDFLASGFPHDIIHYASNSPHIGEKAIIDQALSAMREHFTIAERFHIKIHKTVPTGYGLGSGASNAWHIMVAITKMLKLKTTHAELCAIAQAIGHDVSYFATNKVALYDSKKGIATEVKCDVKPHILLIFPRQIVAKEKVTNNYVALKAKNKLITTPLEVTKIKTFDELASRLQNDFLAASLLNEEIKLLYNELQEQSLLPFGIAGRGTTLFVLSESRSIIRKLREKYRRRGFNALITTLYTKEIK